jgi:5-methylcytosine-specific restriction enzyme A
VRDPAVRNNVKRRANGHCEYCGKSGFVDAAGEAYLECHHIIALANQGHDQMWNVIALCPDHHREAHFGRLAEELERKMTFIVKRKERIA